LNYKEKWPLRRPQFRFDKGFWRREGAPEQTVSVAKDGPIGEGYLDDRMGESGWDRTTIKKIKVLRFSSISTSLWASIAWAGLSASKPGWPLSGGVVCWLVGRCR